jgi:hypothetical protein
LDLNFWFYCLDFLNQVNIVTKYTLIYCPLATE